MTGGDVRPTPTSFIDLGLPSGLLWASCNLGAAVPWRAGNYYSWGNIVGHPGGSGYDFSEQVYNSTPGAELSDDLDYEHDAARVSKGEPWRMPTREEFSELVNNCDRVWVTMKNMPGFNFISRINGKSIFFPAAGFYNELDLSDRGQTGFYWSSTWVSNVYARDLYFTRDSIQPGRENSRRLGMTIRPVRPADQE